MYKYVYELKITFVTERSKELKERINNSLMNYGLDFHIDPHYGYSFGTITVTSDTPADQAIIDKTSEAIKEKFLAQERFAELMENLAEYEAKFVVELKGESE